MSKRKRLFDCIFLMFVHVQIKKKHVLSSWNIILIIVHCIHCEKHCNITRKNRKLLFRSCNSVLCGSYCSSVRLLAPVFLPPWSTPWRLSCAKSCRVVVFSCCFLPALVRDGAVDWYCVRHYELFRGFFFSNHKPAMIACEIAHSCLLQPLISSISCVYSQ